MKDATKYQRAFSRYLHGRPGADGEWRAFCPVHEDPNTSRTPSASFNFDTGVWHCMGCDIGGRIGSLYRTIKEHNGVAPGAKTAVKPKGVPFKNTNNNTDLRPLPSAKQIKLWTKRLLGNEPAMRLIADKRGLSTKTIKRYGVGWDGQRYTIPIYDKDGDLVNIRRYKPNAKQAKDKMISWGKGHGEGRIYGFETLEKHDEVLLCEGEMDRLVALEHGLPAVAHTSGAMVFKAEWVTHFKGKDVFIAYDEDKTGDNGAIKAAQMLKQTARSVHRVKLSTGIDGGDVTDFFMVDGRTADDMYLLMQESSVLFSREVNHVAPTRGKPVTLEESQSTKHDGPIEITVMVKGKQTPAYVAPSIVVGNCGMTAGAPCAICPLAVNEGERKVEVPRDDERLLKFIDASDKRKHELYRELTEAKCKNHVEFSVDGEYEIEELVATTSVDTRSEDAQAPFTRHVYNIGSYKTPINQLARIVGKQVPDPRNQRGVLMGWHNEPVNSDIDNVTLTPELVEALKVFRPRKSQSPLEKCIEIAGDLADNVTHIYGRDMLHVAYDLVWHSATSFKFNDEQVTKGWLECLVIGDTRTGKSETAQALIRHYGAGTLTSCEGVTFAGLVGGAQQIVKNGPWMVTWGLLPLNDRRLAVLDEMSGLKDKGIIESMSSIRSEGRAQIQKISADAASARVRLIWISNPADERRLSQSPGSALSAMKQLIRSPEDIARFDFVTAAANDEVPSSEINRARTKRRRHVYKEDLAHALVMWAWSRRSDQVRWSGDTETYVFAAAEDVGSRYVSDPPLVQIENVRIKIARLAVAFAARTFSTTKSGEIIVVKREHVRSAVEFLDLVYGTQAMGYAAHSRKVATDRKRAEKSKTLARNYLKNNPHLIDVLQAVGASTFRPRDFEEIGGVDKHEANEITTRFLGWRMINRGNSGRMRLEPALVALLRELEGEGD
jgi:hypothetical protein